MDIFVIFKSEKWNKLYTKWNKINPEKKWICPKKSKYCHKVSILVRSDERWPSIFCRNVIKTNNKDSKLNSLFLQKGHATSRFFDLNLPQKACLQGINHLSWQKADRIVWKQAEIVKMSQNKNQIVQNVIIGSGRNVM